MNDNGFLTQKEIEALECPGCKVADTQLEAADALAKEILGMSLPKVPEDMDLTDPKEAWSDGYESAIMFLRMNALAAYEKARGSK